MMITLKIDQVEWRYALQSGLSPSGTWYALLTDNKGQRASVVMATRYTSADAIITNCLVIYRELLTRLLPSRSNATRDNSKITKTTTAEETETSAASTAAITGA